jgi:hypothetical protein
MVVIFNNKHHGNNDISQYYNIIAYISMLGYVLLQPGVVLARWGSQEWFWHGGEVGSGFGTRGCQERYWHGGEARSGFGTAGKPGVVLARWGGQ